MKGSGSGDRFSGFFLGQAMDAMRLNAGRKL